MMDSDRYNLFSEDEGKHTERSSLPREISFGFDDNDENENDSDGDNDDGNIISQELSRPIIDRRRRFFREENVSLLAVEESDPYKQSDRLWVMIYRTSPLLIFTLVLLVRTSLFLLVLSSLIESKVFHQTIDHEAFNYMIEGIWIVSKVSLVVFIFFLVCIISCPPVLDEKWKRDATMIIGLMMIGLIMEIDAFAKVYNTEGEFPLYTVCVLFLFSFAAMVLAGISAVALFTRESMMLLRCTGLWWRIPNTTGYNENELNAVLVFYLLYIFNLFSVFSVAKK